MENPPSGTEGGKPKAPRARGPQPTGLQDCHVLLTREIELWIRRESQGRMSARQYAGALMRPFLEAFASMDELQRAVLEKALLQRPGEVRALLEGELLARVSLAAAALSQKAKQRPRR